VNGRSATRVLRFAVAIFGLGLLVVVSAQQGRREIVSDDFTKPRPTPTPKPFRINGITAPKRNPTTLKMTAFSLPEPVFQIPKHGSFR